MAYAFLVVVFRLLLVIVCMSSLVAGAGRFGIVSVFTRLGIMTRELTSGVDHITHT